MMTKGKGHWNSLCLIGALWLIPIVVISIMIAVGSLNRGVTGHYHLAAANWWSHQSVYTGPKGFNYLPAFVLFFSLFDWLPHVLCEILWRWVATVGLFIGLWLLSGLLQAQNRYKAFVLVSVLALPLGVGALRSGQSSAHLAASLLLAAWCLHHHRLWWATLWLSMALVMKPLAIPAIGLAAVMFSGFWWRAAIGVAVVLLSPYIFAPASYATEVYASFAVNLASCFNPAGLGQRTFSDLNGLLSVFGVRLSGMASLAVGAAAGAVMAIGCRFARGSDGDVRRVMLWLALSGIHIMLFTPMNENNSYVMLSPSFGLWALWYHANGYGRKARAIAAMSLIMLFLPDLVGMVRGTDSGNEFAKFLYPLMTVLFLGILLPQMRQMVSESRNLNRNPKPA